MLRAKRPHFFVQIYIFLVITLLVNTHFIHILCFFIVHHLLPFYFILIQYKVNLNLTSTRFVFFTHAKSSLYNRLLDIAKTAFQKQLTSKSTVFWKVVSSDSYSNPANNLINNCPSRKYALRPVWYWSVTSRHSPIVLIRSFFISTTAWQSAIKQPFSKWWYKLL